MKVGTEAYYQAGVERMRQARELHRAGGNYALAMYTGGLSVECMLRAFRWGKDSSFELVNAAQMVVDRGVLVGLKEKVEEALNQQLHPDHVQLEDDDGICGIVVAARFRGMSALNRQTVIERALPSRPPVSPGPNFARCWRSRR